METKEKIAITVQATVKASPEKVWKLWNTPGHIKRWNQASDDWHTTRSENDLRPGGSFNSRMEAKDGSFGFDFSGTYEEVNPHQLITYSMGDGRKVKVTFENTGNETKITETFDAEQTNPIELQRNGWQAILNNFKKYVESSKMETLHFEKKINASPDNVHKKMLDEKSYTAWTAAFNPSSRYEGTWQKGSKMLFVGLDEKGNRGGVVSMIRENIPGKFVSIEHIGMVQGDKEVTSGTEVEAWAGASENYTFKPENKHTLLCIDMDTNEEYKSYFQETWPKALDILKDICES